MNHVEIRESNSLGDRMKQYEAVSDYTLIRRLPVIIRIDGKAFHTLTRYLEKPFDPRFSSHMLATAQHTAKQIQGCSLAYVASDEISFLVTDFSHIQTDAWFGYRLQKMCSIAAATASVFIDQVLRPQFGGTWLFDARCFSLPLHEVVNYFVWRQQDWARNSLSALAQAHFSHKELLGKKGPEMHEMLLQKGVNWNNLPHYLKRGACIRWDQIDMNPPLFSQQRDYITDHLTSDLW